jgi:hypothetical protein
MLSPSTSLRTGFAKHLWLILRRCPTKKSEILRFAQNDRKNYASDHPELHAARFTDHVLIPGRIPDELDIGFIHAVDR